MAEIAFERLLAALETTRGTAVNPPTRNLNLQGTITPQQSKYRPEESRGVLAATTRSKTVRRWVEWEASGGADTRELPFIASMVLKGGVTATTPSGATNARLWTFARAMTADNLKSATLYTGDPNTQEFQAPYCMADELVISADASGEDGVSLSVKGMGQFWSKTAPSSAPAQNPGPLLAPGDMQVFIDTSSAIGTTELVGRVVSVGATIPTGVTYKYLASGPGGTLTYTRTGREKTSPELKVVFEFLDTAQYDLYADDNGDTVCKMRVLINGPIIEAALRHFIRIDMWGPLDALAWGDLEGSNRTIEFTVTGEYDATAATDCILAVQNDQTTL